MNYGHTYVYLSSSFPSNAIPFKSACILIYYRVLVVSVVFPVGMACLTHVCSLNKSHDLHLGPCLTEHTYIQLGLCSGVLSSWGTRVNRPARFRVSVVPGSFMCCACECVFQSEYAVCVE